MQRPLPATAPETAAPPDVAPAAPAQPVAAEAPATAEATIRWCQRCGVPHAQEATHCMQCGMPLEEDPLASIWQPRPLPTVEKPASTFVPELPAGVRPAATKVPLDRWGGLSKRLRGPRPMSEYEIEAAAAAIVNQARILPDEPLPDEEEGGEFVARGGKVAETPFGRMTDRDRLWLLVGIVGCLLVILVAIALVRVINTPPSTLPSALPSAPPTIRR